MSKYSPLSIPYRSKKMNYKDLPTAIDFLKPVLCNLAIFKVIIF
jgi:hypothetical protein